MAENRKTHRITFACFGLGLCAFVFVSLLSFNIWDHPNTDVASSAPAANLCGRAGSFFAYWCNYYLGPAAPFFLAVLAIWCILFCMNKPVQQLILRIIGILLMGVVLSSGRYLFTPGNEQSLSIGNGGILGIALGHFLLTYTAKTGAVLILCATFLVGLLLAADNVIFFLPKLIYHALERMRQAGPLLAHVGARASALPSIFPKKDVHATAVLTPPISDRKKPAPKNDNLDEDPDVENLFTSQKPPKETKPQNPPAEKPAEFQMTINKPAEPRPSFVQAVTSALSQMLGRPDPAKAEAAPAAGSEVSYQNYQYPPLDLLSDPQHGYSALQEKVIREKGAILEQTLKDFNINASVVEAETGPVITMFELQLAPGIKVSQISNLSNDLARSLGAAAVRVVAPIPGKHTIGIEVPNSEKEKVRIKELIHLAAAKSAKMQIPLFLGKDASGEPLVVDLTAMPHLLIAGTTGSGKSVCINSIIVSILLTQRPDLVKLILVDPKMVEMNSFRDLAHLMCPIVTDMKRAEQILEWLTIKMDERYALLAEARVRNIADYNKLTEEDIIERFCPSNEEEKAKIPLRLPYLVIVIDELADLMMTSAKEVEAYIIRLAQKSRAVGIHIVLATQRPQATVVTGLIKSNLPSRISFRVAARMDSRIVLDQNGAEALLGQGDMLFLQPGTSELIRAQGAFLDDEEIHRIVNYLKEVSQPSYHPELVQLNQVDAASMEKDELFDPAVRVILETKRGSVSLLQRRLTIGYSRASRLIDQMALAGIVGEYKGSQAREVLITPEEYEAIRKQMELDAAQGYADLQEDADDPDSDQDADSEDSADEETGYDQEEEVDEEDDESESDTDKP